MRLAAADRITTREDAAGRSLQQWFEEGRAAGFDALQYENHDGQHSPLPPKVYPMLRQRKPTEEEIKAHLDKGPMGAVRPTPTIGNCSMSGQPEDVGSVPRLYMNDKAGSAVLFQHYLNNNLFVYPEHRDYDPGANGVGGYGDMYPANTPCLLTSQGSSSSDMPFVKALLAMAASLRPEIQSMVIRHHILAPTLQALFRQNTTLIAKDADYFTGAAHPPVFDASALDELRMVTAAQLVSPLSIPPVALVEVLSERKAITGKDFMDRPEITNEAIVTTPAFVSRAFRSMEEVYEMRVTARHSIDVEHRDLIYRWVLLQGDPKLVEIVPENDGLEAKLKVRWHPPMHAATGIRTHRVDIGLFVGTGIAWSAPAFVSFYMLPSELRFFDDQGRLTEMLGEAGNPELGLPISLSDEHWLSLIELVATYGDGLPRKVVSKQFTETQIKAMKKQWAVLHPLQQALEQVPKEKRAEASKQRTALEHAITTMLATTAPDRAGSATTLRDSIEAALSAVGDDAGLFLTNQEAMLKLAGISPKPDALTALRANLKRLTDLGVLIEQADGSFRTEHSLDHLSALERSCLRELNLTLLSHVLLPGLLERSAATLFVDPRLGVRKPWRDVFHYDATGQRSGWTRHAAGRVWHFNREGQVTVEYDKAVPVTYRVVSDRLIFEPVTAAGK